MVRQMSVGSGRVKGGQNPGTEAVASSPTPTLVNKRVRVETHHCMGKDGKIAIIMAHIIAGRICLFLNMVSKHHSMVLET